MKASKKIDMTQGSIMRQVLIFALPICAGNVLQQLYGTVDTLVIGNFCGSVSLAAVGTSSQPVEMLLCIFLGLGTGVSILVSQFSGSGDGKSQREIVATAISFLYICAIPLAVIGQFAGPLVLKIMQVPPDTWDLANSYIRIIFIGTLGNMGFNMNAAGAALATMLAMYCSWLFSVAYIRRQYPELGFTLLPKRLNKAMLAAIVKIGLPLGLNGSIYSVGHILMQSLINMQGSVFIAACAVSSKVTGIANVAINSLSSAATTFSGQNLGAKNYVYLKKGGLQIPLFSGLITCIAGLLVTFFSRPLLSLFTKDPAVLDFAVRYIRIVLPFTWTFAVFNGIISFVNGMGEVRFPTIVNLLMLWAVRIPVGYLITYFIDGGYVMACLPISFAFGMLCMLSYFFSGQWKKIKEQAACQQEETVS